MSGSFMSMCSNKCLVCDREKLARQRQLLNARLGLNVPGSVGAETSELFTAEDFQIHAPAPQSNSVQPKVMCCSKQKFTIYFTK